MTIFGIEFSASQLERIKSVDTVAELCMRVCMQVTGYFKMQLIDIGNQNGADKMETSITMLQWYFGILSRACDKDQNYHGIPYVMSIYLEKQQSDKSRTVKHAFNFHSIKKVPNIYLMEFLQIACVETLKILSPLAINLNPSQILRWETRIMETLADISKTMEMEPIGVGTKVVEVMMKFSIPDGEDSVRDLVK